MAVRDGDFNMGNIEAGADMLNRDATGFRAFPDSDLAQICGTEAFRIEARLDASDHFAISQRFARGLARLLRECESRLGRDADYTRDPANQPENIR